jgi:hypothetical protein
MCTVEAVNALWILYLFDSPTIENNDRDEQSVFQAETQTECFFTSCLY